MSSRRRRSRNRDRFEGGADEVGTAPTTPTPTSTPALVPRPTASAGSGRVIVVADPFWVQPAELTPCEVEGCRNTAPPEAWELVDLDTGNPFPGVFCDEHALAWMARPRQGPTASSAPVA